MSRSEDFYVCAQLCARLEGLANAETVSQPAVERAARRIIPGILKFKTLIDALKTIHSLLINLSPALRVIRMRLFPQVP